jgi:hypothetical protein
VTELQLPEDKNGKNLVRSLVTVAKAIKPFLIVIFNQPKSASVFIAHLLSFQTRFVSFCFVHNNLNAHCQYHRWFGTSCKQLHQGTKYTENLILTPVAMC